VSEETRTHVTATELPPASELDPRLRDLAARDPDGSIPDDGNELLRFWNASPEHAARVMQHHFDLWLTSSMGPRLTELVRLAVAMNTRCPICLAIRRPGARRAGVDEELIAAIDDPDSDLLTTRERLAADYASALAGNHSQITPDTYATLREHFDDREIAELSMMAMSFLGMGRVLETLTRGSACPIQP
jgi:AhpD family alkylhydroperoxidase